MSGHKKTLEIIKLGENENVEFKSSFDRESIETISAFANSKGGSVFVGVSDKGEVTGVTLGKETLQNWINQIKQYTSQAIIPDVETIKVRGKNIVVFSVRESPIKPVACRGRYFKRGKGANHQLTVSEVVNLHLKTFNTSWDFHIDAHHSEKDISLEKVQNFLERVNNTREVPFLDDPLTVLQKFELIREGKITYACFLLFMSGESSLSTIELGRFQSPTIIKDAMRLKTDLLSEVDEVMQFIRKHINKAYIITGSPQREERWDYPLDAIREIVINAIIHRDYSSSQDSIIKIYDDKIEFFNPGKLPEGLTVAKLLKGNYISNIRNKKIADVFKTAGLIEKYGSGIGRILNAFKINGFTPPQFKEMSGGFMVTVYKKTVSNNITAEVTGEVTAEVTGEVAKLLSLCQNPISRKELMKELTLTHEEHFRIKYLLPALKNGYIERTIPEKPQSSLQRYRLTDKGKRLLKNKR